MSKDAPEWKRLAPVPFCEKCGRAYSKDAFASRPHDSEISILDKEHRTWCKQCDSHFMEEGERT